MSVFCVTFDLKYDSTYDSRYKSFMEQLKKSGTWWADPTSFVAVQSTETIDEFCHRIYVHSEFDESKDLFLVLDSEVKAGRVKGVVKDQDLFKLLPFVKKV